jgi:hypothetical protein
VGPTYNLPSTIVWEFICRIIVTNGFLSPSDGGLADFATRGIIINIHPSQWNYSAVSGTGQALHAILSRFGIISLKLVPSHRQHTISGLPIRPPRISLIFMERMLIWIHSGQEVVGAPSGRMPQKQDKRESRSLQVDCFYLIISWRAVRRGKPSQTSRSYLVRSEAIPLSLAVGRGTNFPGKGDDCVHRYLGRPTSRSGDVDEYDEITLAKSGKRSRE